MNGSERQTSNKLAKICHHPKSADVQNPLVSIAEMQHGITFYLKVLHDPNTHIEAEFPVQVRFTIRLYIHQSFSVVER